MTCLFVLSQNKSEMGISLFLIELRWTTKGVLLMKKLKLFSLMVLVLILALSGCAGAGSTTNGGNDALVDTKNDNVNDEYSSSNATGQLIVLDNLTNIENLLFGSDELIVYGIGGTNLYRIVDHNGNSLSELYESSFCPSSSNYVVTCNWDDFEIIDSYEDPDLGTLETTRNIREYFVVDSTGNDIFTTQYIITSSDMSRTTYEGEGIAFCNENRILTYTQDTYIFPSDHSNYTITLYDLNGNCISQFNDVRSYGALFDGKLVLLMDSTNGCTIQVVNQDGQIIAEAEDNCLSYLGDFTFFPSNNWTTDGFIDGYVLVTDGSEYHAVFISEDLSKRYIIKTEYLQNYYHSGTLVSSKIIIDGEVSDEFYLVDLALCDKDEEGYCIPTLDAAVCKEGYQYLSISCLFNQVEPYALVSDGTYWGYLSLSGDRVQMYTDAGAFYDGKAIVMQDDEIFIINHNFEQISNTLTGYDSVCSMAGNVFYVKLNDTIIPVVYE